MSVIKDLLNGITPQQRNLLDEQERKERFEREQQLQEEKYQKMKSADVTKQMANWVAETLLLAD